jgi:hypothetical protein
MEETPPAQLPAYTANPNAPLYGAAQTVSETGLLAIVWVAFSIATVFVALRLAVRLRQNRSLLFDDCWIIFAWLCLLTMGILQTLQMPYLWNMTYLSAGRILPDLDTPTRMEQMTRWQFPVIKLFWTTLWAVKASFLAVFFRLVKPFPVLRRLWYCVAVFAFLAYVGCWIASTLTCSPPLDYFKAGMPHDPSCQLDRTDSLCRALGACGSPHEVWMQSFNVIYSTAVDIACDLMIMALPIAILPSLQLDIRRKVGLCIAFSLGIIIISVAIVRMTQIISGKTVDLVGLAIWGAIEASTAVIVGSLPPLKALLTRNVRKYSSRNKSGYGTGPTRKGAGTGNNGEYGPNSISRTVIVAESIPLDDRHRSEQKNGGIYMQRTYKTTVEFDETSSRDDDEVGIVQPRQELRRH